MTWRFIDFQRYHATENMAIDEAIFQETIKNKKPPTIRFYGWQPAAISIGYFQDLKKEINIENCRAADIDIVRRPSGGKTVFHCHEVTYSVIACNQELSFPPDIMGTYKIISRCIAYGLSFLGIRAVLVEAERSLPHFYNSSCCFSAPSKNELLVNGRKICGSAQMRTKGGFLQHGSILLKFDPLRAASFILPLSDNDQLHKLADSVTTISEEAAAALDENEVCASLKKGFTTILNKKIMTGILTPAEQVLAIELKEKYADLSWKREKEKAFRSIF